MSAVEDWASGDREPHLKFNDLIQAAGQALTLAFKPSAESGLDITLGAGPLTSSVTVADQEVTGTNGTNYVVAVRTTGVASISTSTTNWDDTGTYGRVGVAVFAGGVLTSYTDLRFALGGIFGPATVAADQRYVVDGTPATDDTYHGRGITGVNAGATISQWQTVYMGSGGEWLLADATDDSAAPCRALAAEAGTDGNPMTVVTEGVIRNDAWAWTVGGAIYLSTTAGGMTQTAPSATGEIVQSVGFAISADVMYLCIGAATYIEVA
jgi:hypothetical protein